MNMSARSVPMTLVALLFWGGAVSCQSKPETAASAVQPEGLVNADVNVAAFAALIDTAKQVYCLMFVRTESLLWGIFAVLHKLTFTATIFKRN